MVMAKGEKIWGIVGGVLAVAIGAAKIVSSIIGRGDELGCIWHCDFCDAIMNDQPGFTTASGTWTCTNCGALNDVSENNIVSDDDEITPHPLQEPEDAETRLSYDPTYEGFDLEDL